MTMASAGPGSGASATHSASRFGSGVKAAETNNTMTPSPSQQTIGASRLDLFMVIIPPIGLADRVAPSASGSGRRLSPTGDVQSRATGSAPFVSSGLVFRAD